MSSHAASLLGRLDHLRDGEQCDVDETAGHVAHQRFQQSRQQRGGQMRTIGLQRVEHVRRRAPGVVGRQSPVVEHARGQKRRRQDLDVTGLGQRLADRAATLLHRGKAPSRRGRWQHRRE